MCIAAAAPQQLAAPAGVGCRADPPAGHRGTGRRARRIRAQHQGGDAASLGGQLQAAAGGKRHRAHLAYHRRYSGAAQSLLQGPERFDVFAHTDDDQPAGVDPEAGQPRRIEPAGIERRVLAPQHRALATRQPGDQGQAEPGCRPGIPGNHLMQGAARQASAQPAVYGCYPERKTNPAGAAFFQSRYLTPQNR